MIPVSRKRRTRQAGAVMVEGALCLMSFLMITLGTIEFSMAVQANNFCSWVARDAVRWAAVRGASSPVPATSTSISSYVKAQVVGMDKAKFTITTTFSPDNNQGSAVRVSVQYLVIPLANFAVKSNLTVGSTAEMTIVR